jgi:hypothetical protein
MDGIFTQKQDYQFRGPQDSSKYNEYFENVFRDLVFLINKNGLNEENIRRLYQRFGKELVSAAAALTTLESRVASLEAGVANKIYFSTSGQIDNARFVSTAFAINNVDANTYNSFYNLLTLPKVDTSSVSKLRYLNSDGVYILPSSFEAVVEPDISSADGNLATIDTSQPYNAILPDTGRIWERNVLSPSSGSPAIMNFYMRIPTDLATTADTNVIELHPFPMRGVDVLEISYSTRPDAALNSTETFTPLNNNILYQSNSNAVGYIAPGAWSGDAIISSGPKLFYFDPKQVTAFKIKLRQTNYYFENNQYIYSYGLSKLDARYDKFLDVGKTMIRFDAPAGKTISNVSSIQPLAYNVSQAELDDVLSFRTVWETSFNSGTYTLSPVALSHRVWVEVTMNKTLNGGTPALNGLSITYS